MTHDSDGHLPSPPMTVDRALSILDAIVATGVCPQAELGVAAQVLRTAIHTQRATLIDQADRIAGLENVVEDLRGLISGRLKLPEVESLTVQGLLLAVLRAKVDRRRGVLLDPAGGWMAWAQRAQAFLERAERVHADGDGHDGHDGHRDGHDGHDGQSSRDGHDGHDGHVHRPLDERQRPGGHGKAALDEPDQT